MIGSLFTKVINRIKLLGKDGVTVADIRTDGDGVNRVATDGVISFGNLEDIVAMTRSSGFHVNEQYDTIVSGIVDGDTKILEYSLDSICQFQMLIEKNGTEFVIIKRACEFFLLQENGNFLLQETGDKIKIAGLIPI